jgi:hypothetical protein
MENNVTNAATLAARLISARARLVDFISETLSVSNERSALVAAALIKHKLVKLDPHVGQFSSVHGAVLGERALRNVLVNINA